MKHLPDMLYRLHPSSACSISSRGNGWQIPHGRAVRNRCNLCKASLRWLRSVAATCSRPTRELNDPGLNGTSLSSSQLEERPHASQPLARHHQRMPKAGQPGPPTSPQPIPFGQPTRAGEEKPNHDPQDVDRPVGKRQVQQVAAIAIERELAGQPAAGVGDAGDQPTLPGRRPERGQNFGRNLTPGPPLLPREGKAGRPFPRREGVGG